MQVSLSDTITLGELFVSIAYILFLRLYAWPNGLECVEEKEYTRILSINKLNQLINYR